MKCPECGKELKENAVFCGSCGAEIICNDTTNTTDGKETEKTAEAKKNANAAEKQQVNNNKNNKTDKKSGGKKVKPKTVLKIAGVIAALILIIIIIVCVSASIKASKGRKIFDSVPLGRDIDIIESDTGVAFISGESSEYGALNHIVDYDYICESEDSVTVSGIKVPEWAVLLRKGTDDTITEAVLYNFNNIKHNWMGEKTASEIKTTVIEYGMSAKSAERTLGLKPYTIVRESSENTTTYVYRYHYTDEESGNTVVKNFYVVVDDVDNQVVDVCDEKLDYLALIFQGESKIEA